MATKPRRHVIKSDMQPADTDAEAERLRASGRDSMPPHVAGETPRETSLFGFLPVADRQFLVECRVDVERKVSIKSHTLFDIGDILNAAKARLPHGAYLAWVDKILGIAPRCSQNYSGAAATFVGEDVRETISFLGPTVIYKLSCDDPRLAKLRTRLLVEIDAGARPTGREVEAMIAVALGKEPKAKNAAKTKHSVADPDIKDKVFESVIETHDSATNETVDLIFQKCKDESNTLLSLLTLAQPELVVKLLIGKCEAYRDCINTPYSPKFDLNIESVLISGMIGSNRMAQDTTST